MLTTQDRIITIISLFYLLGSQNCSAQQELEIFRYADSISTVIYSGRVEYEDEKQLLNNLLSRISLGLSNLQSSTDSTYEAKLVMLYKNVVLRKGSFLKPVSDKGNEFLESLELKIHSLNDQYLDIADSMVMVIESDLFSRVVKERAIQVLVSLRNDSITRYLFVNEARYRFGDIDPLNDDWSLENERTVMAAFYKEYFLKGDYEKWAFFPFFLKNVSYAGFIELEMLRQYIDSGNEYNYYIEKYIYDVGNEKIKELVNKLK